MKLISLSIDGLLELLKLMVHNFFIQGEKEEEIPEEEVEMPSIKRLIKLNITEWPYLLIGSIFAAVVGAFPVVFAFILSEILRVRTAQLLSVKLL